jgi:dienelactone hydrolase
MNAAPTRSHPAADLEPIAFPSTDGTMTGGTPTLLLGLLRRPEGPGPFPAVVMLHGCAGLYARNGRLTGRHEEWARTLSDQGFVTLLVDSFTPRGLTQICTMKERPLRAGRERIMDAYGALRFLQQLPDVRSDGVGLLGWSHGGVTTLFSVDPATPARPKLAPEADFRAAVAFYPGCRPDSQHAWSANIPLLLLLGGKDDWCPAHHCVTVAERAKARGSPIDVVVYPDAHHDFDAPDLALRRRSGLAFAEGGTASVGTHPEARADALQRVPAFLHRHLQPLV